MQRQKILLHFLWFIDWGGLLGNFTCLVVAIIRRHCSRTGSTSISLFIIIIFVIVNDNEFIVMQLLLWACTMGQVLWAKAELLYNGHSSCFDVPHRDSQQSTCNPVSCVVLHTFWRGFLDKRKEWLAIQFLTLDFPILFFHINLDSCLAALIHHPGGSLWSSFVLYGVEEYIPCR